MSWSYQEPDSPDEAEELYYEAQADRYDAEVEDTLVREAIAPGLPDDEIAGIPELEEVCEICMKPVEHTHCVTYCFKSVGFECGCGERLSKTIPAWSAGDDVCCENSQCTTCNQVKAEWPDEEAEFNEFFFSGFEMPKKEEDKQ